MYSAGKFGCIALTIATICNVYVEPTDDIVLSIHTLVGVILDFIGKIPEPTRQIIPDR